MEPELAALIEAGRTLVGTASADVWYDDLDASRAKLDTALEAELVSGDPEVAARLGAALWPYWCRRAGDGPAWLERVRNSAEGAQASEALAELQYGVGLMAFRRGDTTESRRANEDALRVADASGSERGRALAHIGLFRVSFREADYDASLGHAMLAGEHAAAVGEEALETLALHLRAEVYRAQGRYADAVPLYLQAIESDAATGDERSLTMEHYNLGSVLLQVGDLDEAQKHLDIALDMVRKGVRDQLAYAMLGFAGLAARRGDAATAGRLLGAVRAHYKRLGEVVDPAEQLELATHVEAARSADAAAYDAAYTDGLRLTLAEAAATLG